MLNRILVILVMFSLLACNNNSQPDGDKNEPANEVTPTDKLSPDTTFTPQSEQSEIIIDTTLADAAEKEEEPAVTENKPQGKTHDYYKLKGTKGFHFKSGQVLYTIKKWHEGIKEFDTVLQIDPEFAEAYVKRGHGKMEIKDYKGALYDLEKAVNYRPDDSIAFLNLGMVRYQLGDMEGCIEANNEVIRISPNNFKPFYNRGIAYAQLKQYDKAIEDFTSAVILEPTYHEGFFNRGLALYFSGDQKAACIDWEKAKKQGSAKAGRVIEKYCR
nr:tetratricopeptide repeat protein [Bacteroidota bacterium]